MSSIRLLICLLVIVLLCYVILDITHTDTFYAHYPCHGPCYSKNERTCCQCPRCAWFIDHNYNGRCVRRGNAPDSCLNRAPRIHYTYPYYHSNWWYHPSNWFVWNNRPRPEESCLVKDSWGRCIEPATPPPHRRRGRHRRRRHWWSW